MGKFENASPNPAQTSGFSLIAEIPRESARESGSQENGLEENAIAAITPNPTSTYSNVLKNIGIRETKVVEPPEQANVLNVFTKPVVAGGVEKSVLTAPTSALAVAYAISGNSNIPVVPVEECHYETKLFPNYAKLLINEVGWMGTTESSGNEWIELRNMSDQPLDVDKYWLIDKQEQIKVHLPKKIIPAGKFFILERSEDALPEIDADVVYAGQLANSNEGLRLFDPGCNLVDQVVAEPKWPAGSSESKRSMQRGLDWNWYTFSGSAINEVFGTPGAVNTAGIAGFSGAIVSPGVTGGASNVKSGTTTSTSSSTSDTPDSFFSPPNPVESHILISEIFVGSELSADDEFIEIYNAGAESVPLTGWSLKKKSSTGSESSLVSAARLEGKSIEPGQYFLIVREGKYRGTVAGDATWPSSYSLAYTNNSIVLYDPSGAKKDEASWVEIEKGSSYARQPIDGGTFVQGAPTPKQ